jgi:hypothetical protein
VRFEEILDGLQQSLAFCESVGLGRQAEIGRLGQYSRRIQKLLEVLPRLSDSSVTDEESRRLEQDGDLYRAALCEGVEVCEITDYLCRERPAGFESRLKIVLDGPELPSEEDTKSNQARNIQFELLTARDIAIAGIQPRLAEPDIRIEVLGRPFHIACKRVFSEAKLRTRLREAGEQLHRSLRDEPATARGIVAMSLSRLLNPAEMQRTYRIHSKRRRPWITGSQRRPRWFGPTWRDCSIGGRWSSCSSTRRATSTR